MDRIDGRRATEKARGLCWALVAVLIIAVHFGVLLFFFEPAISTPDAHGYFAQARLLAKQGTSFLQPESPVQYRGPHWYLIGDNCYATTFPPGLPSLLAVIYRFAGSTAALLLSPLLTSLTLLALFFLCREWVGATWGLVAVLIMATNPYVNEHALFGDSHAALDFFFIWSLVFLAVWIRTNSGLWAFCTGLCSGIIPTIRYPELVLCLAILFWMIFQLPRRRVSWHSALLAGFGAALPLGALLLRNQAVFGKFWKTGYAFLHEPSLFGWGYFKTHCLPYILSLATEGSGLIFLVGVAGITFLLIRPETRAFAILLGALTVPLTAVYMAYFFPPDPQSMRYLLPTLFVYALATVWLLKSIVPNRRPWNILVPVLLVILSVAWGLPRSVFAMSHLKECNGILAQVASLIDAHVEKNSVLIAGEAVNQNLDFLGRWRLVNGKLLDFAPGNEAGPVTVGPQLGLEGSAPNAETPPRFGTPSGKERFELVAREVWRWTEPHHRVYVLGDRGQVDRLRAQLSVRDELLAVARLDLPDWSDRPYPRRTQAKNGRPAKPEAPPGPMGPDRIFDLVLNGQDLVLLEWRRDPQESLPAKTSLLF